MKTSMTPVFLLALALTGFTDQPLTLSDPTGSAFARAGVEKHAARAVPISGRCTTTFPPLPRPLPAVYRQVATGECQLSHLGRASLRLVQDIDFMAGTQTSVEVTYTAANGDVLRAMNVGTSTRSGTGVAFSATVTFIGGTGRFANAVGQAQVTGTADFIANTSAYTIEGEIGYDAGNRSGS
jgi:hypothetical protein